MINNDDLKRLYDTVIKKAVSKCCVTIFKDKDYNPRTVGRKEIEKKIKSLRKERTNEQRQHH